MKHNNQANTPDNAPGCRLLRLAAFYGGIIAAGLLYALLCRLLGTGIPCLFHVLTDLKCPGCGITRMALSLLRLDLRSAFAWNAGIMLASPFLLFTFISESILYIKHGRRPLRRSSSIILLSVGVWLLVFAILRNIL